MMTLTTAALVAAAPAPSTDGHAQHEVQGQAGHQQMMNHQQMMADCKKCREEIERKHAADASDQSKHAH